MTVRGTVLLWVAVAALGIYLWTSTSAPVDTDRTIPSGPPLLALDPMTATAVTITDREEGTATLVRDGASWTLSESTQPLPADAPNGLLATLAAIRPLTTIVSGAPGTAQDYGLDPPQQRIHIVPAPDAPALDLALGDYNPSGTAVYARRGGEDDVLLVGAIVRWEALKVLRAVRQNPARSPAE